MKALMNFSLPRRGRAGVGAGGVSSIGGLASAACPHPDLPPGGEGAIRQGAYSSCVSCVAAAPRRQ